MKSLHSYLYTYVSQHLYKLYFQYKIFLYKLLWFDLLEIISLKVKMCKYQFLNSFTILSWNGSILVAIHLDFHTVVYLHLTFF